MRNFALRQEATAGRVQVPLPTAIKNVSVAGSIDINNGVDRISRAYNNCFIEGGAWRSEDTHTCQTTKSEQTSCLPC